MDNRSTIIDHIFSRTGKEIKLGLSRIMAAARDLGNPQYCYKTVHVAGTNGKGSTCAFMESILRKAGFRTGFFSKPHIVNFEERFLLNGAPASSSQWISIYHDLEPLIEKYGLTFFEISTLIAFELFKRENVEWAVIETGLGGRLDATNILHPEITVITTIDYDHTHILGNDLVQIAREKLGIVQNGIPLVVSGQNQAEVLSAMQNFASNQSAPFTIADTRELLCTYEDGKIISFTYKETPFSIRLTGSFQINNAFTAIRASQILGIPDHAIQKGIACAFIPGRFQHIRLLGKDVVFDVGHNPQSIEAFCTTLEKQFPSTRRCIITGIMADKECAPMLSRYCRAAEKVIVSHPHITRAATAEDLYNLTPQEMRSRVSIIESVSQALDWALKNWNGTIGVSGSFHTVGEAMENRGIDPYGSN